MSVTRNRGRVLDDREPLNAVRDGDFILAFAVVSENELGKKIRKKKRAMLYCFFSPGLKIFAM